MAILFVGCAWNGPTKRISDAGVEHDLEAAIHDIDQVRGALTLCAQLPGAKEADCTRLADQLGRARNEALAAFKVVDRDAGR